MLRRLIRTSMVILSLAALALLTVDMPAFGASAEKTEAVTAHKPEAAKESQAALVQHDVQEELGKKLPYWSVIPFVAILLCIALIPLFLGHWWEPNFNKGIITVVCSIPVFIYLVFSGPLGQEALIEVIQEYYAFIMLLVALFTISGGIYVEGNLKGTPTINTVFLGLGALLASFIGTTGATMLLIRPLLKTNQERKHKTHTFIFLIFLVANIGGSLLPVGDPPLFLGYLFGVPFFWTLRLWPIWLLEVAILLVLYYLWDTRAYARESKEPVRQDLGEKRGIKIQGQLNILLILLVLCSVVFFKKYEFAGVTLDLAWIQQPAMILLALISFTHDHKQRAKAHGAGNMDFKSPREKNAFTFAAMIEVAVLFAGIFITMTPAICLLKAHGAETGVTKAWQFYWMSGGLSSFLDNAPTYATYFALGQGVTKGLMSQGVNMVLVDTPSGPIWEQILVAISIGSVFMGANSYIGNAPNFMVKSICEEAKVKMPSFFGYMVYSVGILIPTFLLITFIFF
jgi:Na+/H+ antiporter NhaD/arsenite permease-like protein